MVGEADGAGREGEFPEQEAELEGQAGELVELGERHSDGGVGVGLGRGYIWWSEEAVGMRSE